MEEVFFNISGVSRYLNIPKSTIYKLSQKNEIPSVKIGKQLRFRKSSIDKWITEKETGSRGQADTPIALFQGDNPGRGKTKHILLIDDDQLVLRSIAQLFRGQGYDVEVAQMSEEALKKVEGRSFDLIITDIRMPGMNGLETIKRIRQINIRYNRTTVPEMIITGYIDTDAEQEAERLGISDYLYKPFTITDFMKRVERKLELKAGLN